MLKKIGIMTMQRIKNYGSFLQAYALKNIIEDLGYKVEFIDYKIEPPIVHNNKQTKKNKLINLMRNKLNLTRKLQYIKHKINFAQKYNYLLGLSNKKKYNKKVDVLVIGSDEVFNCIQNNSDVGYSLELFGKNNQAKKLISYAASFGNTTINKILDYEKKEEIAYYLNKFNALSVRDKNSYKIIKSLTNKSANIHLDPVLIYDFKNLPNIATTEKYLIVYGYIARFSKEESEKIKEFAESQNLKIYAIGGPQNFADKYIDCDPFEVLSYFKKAEYIITDTFHGSIFSIVTNRPFATFIRKSTKELYGNEEKITDLLSSLALEERIISDISYVKKILKKKIDYNKIKSILRIEKEKSRNYLIKNLK